MDIAVLVNMKARRGSASVARAVRAAMPGARVVETRSLGDALAAAGELGSSPPDLLVSGGGDGTAVTLLTALRDQRVVGGPAAPPLALLPLGTGNGWAFTVGAPGWRKALARLRHATFDGAVLPLRRFDLLDVHGVLAPFAGAGWDSLILDDYHAVKSNRLLPRALREGVLGYGLSVGFRSIPRALFDHRPLEVEVENLGEEAMTLDAAGQPVRIPGAGPGTILYRGPVSVCGCGTTPHLGFGFRAFPFAGVVAGRFNARVYADHVLSAASRVGPLFRGRWRLPNDHQWLLTHCRFRFSRPVPLQAGGDIRETRDEIEFQLARDAVQLVDFRALSANRLAA